MILDLTSVAGTGAGTGATAGDRASGSAAFDAESGGFERALDDLGRNPERQPAGGGKRSEDDTRGAAERPTTPATDWSRAEAPPRTEAPAADAPVRERERDAAGQRDTARTGDPDHRPAVERDARERSSKPSASASRVSETAGSGAVAADAGTQAEPASAAAAPTPAAGTTVAGVAGGPGAEANVVSETEVSAPNANLENGANGRSSGRSGVGTEGRARRGGVAGASASELALADRAAASTLESPTGEPVSDRPADPTSLRHDRVVAEPRAASTLANTLVAGPTDNAGSATAPGLAVGPAGGASASLSPAATEQAAAAAVTASSLDAPTEEGTGAPGVSAAPEAARQPRAAAASAESAVDPGPARPSVAESGAGRIPVAVAEDSSGSPDRGVARAAAERQDGEPVQRPPASATRMGSLVERLIPASSKRPGVSSGDGVAAGKIPGSESDATASAVSSRPAGLRVAADELAATASPVSPAPAVAVPVAAAATAVATGAPVVAGPTVPGVAVTEPVVTASVADISGAVPSATVPSSVGLAPSVTEVVAEPTGAEDSRLAHEVQTTLASWSTGAEGRVVSGSDQTAVAVPAAGLPVAGPPATSPLATSRPAASLPAASPPAAGSPAADLTEVSAAGPPAAGPPAVGPPAAGATPTVPIASTEAEPTVNAPRVVVADREQLVAPGSSDTVAPAATAPAATVAAAVPPAATAHAAATGAGDRSASDLPAAPVGPAAGMPAATTPADGGQPVGSPPTGAHNDQASTADRSDRSEQAQASARAAEPAESADRGSTSKAPSAAEPGSSQPPHLSPAEANVERPIPSGPRQALGGGGGRGQAVKGEGAGGDGTLDIVQRFRENDGASVFQRIALGRDARLWMGASGPEMRVRVEPNGLGAINIRTRLEDQTLATLLSVERAEVGRAISDRVDALGTSLAEAAPGVSHRLEVAVGADNGGGPGSFGSRDGSAEGGSARRHAHQNGSAASGPVASSSGAVDESRLLDLRA